MPKVESTDCKLPKKERNDFLHWQDRGYVQVHGYVESGQFLDVQEFVRHADCECRKVTTDDA